jgi:hypothetical protein
MNDKRRKELAAIKSQVEELASRVEAVRDDEQDALNNMPESLQDAANGEKSRDAVSALEDAITSLENAATELETAAE